MHLHVLSRHSSSLMMMAAAAKRQGLSALVRAKDTTSDKVHISLPLLTAG